MRRRHGHLVVVVGCGRLGSQLADRLSRGGLEVIVVDGDRRALDALSAEFSGSLALGDATEIGVLRSAHVGDAAAVIAATRDDHTNMMVAQVARDVLGVPQILARVFDPARVRAYQELDIQTVCPTALAADEAVRRLSIWLNVAVGELP